MKTYEDCIKKYKSYKKGLPYISQNAIEKLEDDGYIVFQEDYKTSNKSVEADIKEALEWCNIKSIRFAETNGTSIKGLRFYVLIIKGSWKDNEVDE